MATRSYGRAGLLNLLKDAMSIDFAQELMANLDKYRNYEYIIAALKINPIMMAEVYEIMSIQKKTTIENWNGKFRNRESIIDPDKDVTLRDIVIIFSNRQFSNTKAWSMIKKVFFNNNDNNINKYMAEKWNMHPPFNLTEPTITFSEFLDKYIGENIYCERYMVINGKKFNGHYPNNKLIGTKGCVCINGILIERFTHEIIFTTYTCINGVCRLNHDSRYSSDGKKLLKIHINTFGNGIIECTNDNTAVYIQKLIDELNQNGPGWDIATKEKSPFQKFMNNVDNMSYEDLKEFGTTDEINTEKINNILAPKLNDTEKKFYLDMNMEKICEVVMDIYEAAIFMVNLDKHHFFEYILYILTLYPQEMAKVYRSISCKKKLNIENWDGNFTEVNICDKFTVSKDQILCDLARCTCYVNFVKSEAWSMVRKKFFNNNDRNVKKYMMMKRNK